MFTYISAIHNVLKHNTLVEVKSRNGVRITNEKKTYLKFN